MMESVGDHAQVRIIAQQLIEAYGEMRPKEASIPAPLKWAAAIFFTVFTSLITAGLIWMVVTLASMSNQVGIITEQLRQNGAVDLRFSELNRRVEKLEQHKPAGE